MDLQNEKCVMVMDENLPLGIIANAAAIMGIIAFPVPILKGNAEKMKGITETELNYFGIAICGAKKKVNQLTGSMALLR